MMHKPIQIQKACLSFPHKICFEDFTTSIAYGSRIAIIGRNGCGKSSLLNMIQGIIEPTGGEISSPKDLRIGYVAQVIEEFCSLSGGQRLNKSLTRALHNNPNMLLLDEPTNHLDGDNRKSLMRMLRSYHGTLLIVSHDVEVLQNCVDILWHIDNGRVDVFSGNYDNYMQEIESKRISVKKELLQLNRLKKETHQSLMKEQIRSSKSRVRGEKSIDQRKWPTVVSKAKALQANQTSGRKKSEIRHKKLELIHTLSELRLPEIIKPKFSLDAVNLSTRILLSISEGTVGYEKAVLKNINLNLAAEDRVAITGNNGSGKSTFIKAILSDSTVVRTGFWQISSSCEIGYLDQHYETLNPNKSVLEEIQELVPKWSHIEIRRHLNDFLFYENIEVNALVSTLSGGEKARLSLAKIAAKTPSLLLLDEITNNLDLETKEHVTQVLKEYPGTLMVVSHDEEFCKMIGVGRFFQIKEGFIYDNLG